MKNVDHEKLERLMEEFRNRPIYQELSPEILVAIPDDKIEQTIIDYIHTKIIDYDEEFDVVSNLSDGFQLVYSTWLLEAEVNNGGFNQFFINSSGQFADMALRSLKMIGAIKYYEILLKAIEIHTQEKDNPVLQNLYSQNTREAFSKSYKITSLGECDEEFYKLDDSLSELIVQYIRLNPELFAGS